MHLPGALVACLCLLAAPGARAENRFRRPPGPGPAGDFRDNPAYALGTQLDLQWETDFESVDLLIWHEAEYTSEPTYATIVSKTRSLGMLWTVGYSGFPAHHDPTKGPVYFIQMFRSGDSVGNITSHYFNITESAAAPSSSASTTTRLLSEATASETTPSASASADAEPTGAASGVADAGVSRGAVAGIAVGAALGALGVAALVGWLLWRRWRRKHAGGPREVPEAVVRDDKGYYAGPVENQGRYEVDGRGAMYEMPGEAHVGQNGTRTL